LISRAENLARTHDPAGSERLIAQAEAAGNIDATEDAEARALAAEARGNWQAMRDNANVAVNARSQYAHSSAKFYSILAATQFKPLVAIAEARLGEFAQAHHTIEATPSDCYDCARMRGVIDAMERNMGGAVFWFGYAIAQAPSLPFAYADWGEMLLHGGRYDAAIAKFEIANKKGPRFADPLEMWGEALMLKNRSDLALDKFEEANRYAPNWGRLHLKWGEALIYAGKPDEAKQQFAIAAGLDLFAADKAELAHMRTLHG
jgi:tetratricopeptide (TPR) repeat protein